jgi:hypothetical protein
MAKRAFGSVGKFEQTSNLMYACDPSYKVDPKGDDLVQRIKNVNKGFYHVLVDVKGGVVQALLIFHESIFDPKNKTKFSENVILKKIKSLDFKIPPNGRKDFTKTMRNIIVDSGSAGFFDSAYKDKTEEFTAYPEFYEKNKHRTWYDIMSERFTQGSVVFASPHGAACLTDHGDGSYDLAVARINGKMVAAYIDFTSNV